MPKQYPRKAVVNAGVPADGDVPIWNEEFHQWQPGAAGGGTAGSRVVRFQYTFETDAIAGIPITTLADGEQVMKILARVTTPFDDPWATVYVGHESEHNVYLGGYTPDTPDGPAGFNAELLSPAQLYAWVPGTEAPIAPPEGVDLMFYMDGEAGGAVVATEGEGEIVVFIDAGYA